ncbi:MAG: 4Fe-4S dicluster domain-containing protein [Bacteroidales bacterium]
MGVLLDRLKSDLHYQEGMQACINCGICTAICPAAEYYDYDPRLIVELVQRGEEAEVEALLKSDTIWYCGECMSCRTRCPRNNTPGLIIMALRALAQETGLFVESEKGRQQIYLKRTIGHDILKTGYCVYAEGLGTDTHPDQGPVWDWRQQHWKEIMERLGTNYQKPGAGAMRRIPDEALQELHRIFAVTGAFERFEKIEKYSEQKARSLGLQWDDTLNNEYVQQTYNGPKRNT